MDEQQPSHDSPIPAIPPPQAHPCLIYLSGIETGRIVPLQEGQSYLLGRNEEADLYLPLPEMAPHHAKLSRRGQEVFFEDLGYPPNGCLVNGQMRRQSILQHHDTLQVGAYALFRVSWLDEDTIDCQLRLYAESTCDALTGLHNHRHFTSLLLHDWSYARRHQRPLALVFLDLDHFRLFNHTHGFDRGDQLLRAVAAQLKKTVRREDLLCRYSADTFAVLLRETSLQGAIQQAERIRHALSLLPPLDTQEQEKRTTVSFGVVSSTPSDLDRPYLLLQEALEHVKIAKQRGRDRICAPRPKITQEKEKVLS